jgi:uncharacterized protein (TIGR00288 family)
MKPPPVGDGDHALAVFIDFENLALGFNGRRDRFEIERVLERLVEKGKIVVKRAYCDWSRFGPYTGPLHEAAIELIEIPKRHATGKNSADIRLVVDAMDLAYSKDHIDTFVIVSGDSDFSPLVSKLKELGKHVLGVGLAEATSNLLRDNCDEFIYYEDLGKAPALSNSLTDQVPENKRKMFNLLLDSLLALRRENKDVIQASMVKDTMKRKKPSFNEEYYGYRTFSELLEDAARFGLVDVAKGRQSGTLIVTRFGTEPTVTTATAEPAGEGERRTGTRRRRRGGRRPAADGGEPKPAARPPAGEEVVPLGRAIIDDVELLDEDVPSYRPTKSEKPSRSLPPPEPRPEPREEHRAPTRQPARPRRPEASPTPPAEPPPSRHRTDLPEDNGFGAGIDV